MGTFSAKSNTYDGRYLELVITQSADATTNKSTLNWTLTSAGGNSNFYQIYPTTVKINGEQVYYKGLTYWDDKVFPAAKGSISGSLVVDHNNDGTLTVPVQFTTAVYSSGYIKDYGGDFVLDPISRKAVLTYAPNFSSSTNPTISYTNPLGVVVSSLSACISLTGANDDISYREISKTGSSYTFNLTASERSILNNATSGTSRYVMFIVKSVIDGQTYYSSQNVVYSVSASGDTKPDVSVVAVPDNYAIAAEVRDRFSGLFVEGKSCVQVTINAIPKGGASIAGYESTFDGTTYRSASFLTKEISSSGTRYLSSTVTDSRGFSNTDSRYISVLPYKKPVVADAFCYRSDASGNPSSGSTTIWIKATRQYSPVSVGGVQKNHCELRWRSKTMQGAWSEWHTIIASGVAGNTFNAQIQGTFISSTAYNIEISAIDEIGEMGSIIFDIPTDTVPLHLAAGGKNIGVGRYADTTTPEVVNVAWKTIFEKGFEGSFGVHHVEGSGIDVKSYLSELKALPDGFTPCVFDFFLYDTPSPRNKWEYASGIVIKSGGSGYAIFVNYEHNIAITSFRSSDTSLYWNYIYCT